MWIANRSNSVFSNEEYSPSIMSRHAFNLQSNTCSEMIPMTPYFGITMINNNNNTTTTTPINSSNSSCSSKLDLVSEWSNEEQYKLEDGLEKYKNKPSIMKYIKIAAILPDKSVRDVALRCRWMTRKRRKSEEVNCGRRLTSSKDKQVESSSTSSVPSVLPEIMASYPFLMPFTSSSNKQITCEDVSGHAVNLLEQNTRAFTQIKANLSSYNLQDNLDLFCQTRNNLITIQNDMNNMPGFMSQMPPLPVSINDELSVTILSGRFQMKQEGPLC